MVANSEVEPPELAGSPTGMARTKTLTEPSSIEQRNYFGRGTERRSNDGSGVRRNTQMWRVPYMKDV